MKKFTLFLLLGAVVTLALFISSPEYQDFRATQTAVAMITATPTSTAVPTPTEQPILLADLESLNDCGLVLAKVHLSSFVADSHNPPSWEKTNLHEVWKIYVFGGPEKVTQMRPDMNLNDRWGNPIADVQFSSSMREIPLSAISATFYNKYGVMAGWDEGANHAFRKSGFCHEVTGEVSWAKPEELHKFAEFKFEYPTGALDANEDDNFVAEFYAGAELDWKDFDVLWFKAMGLNSNQVNWNGSYDFGPTSVATSFFGIDINNTVQWSFVQDNPNVFTTVNTNVFLPLEREVVIKVTYASGKVATQRLVMHRWFPDTAPIVIAINP